MLLPLNVLAQEEGEEEHSLTENSRALQFGIGENFRLTSFNGTAFSYKRHTAVDRANRITFGFLNLFIRNNRTETDDSASRRVDSSMFVGYSWMHYLRSGTDILPYFGYGPRLNLGYNNVRQPNDATDSGFSIGLSGVVYTGVEWFFHSSMSLHAEYRASLFARQTYNKWDSSSDSRNTVIGLGSGGVLFGVSAYF